jgi:hypothetical protein
MIRKLLLLLVVTTILQNTTYGQQAAVLANCFYQSANNRIVIRLAIRNNTASGQDFELSGIRVGVQYNAAAVTPAGYTSYLYENGVYNSSLNGYTDQIACIGNDTNGGGYIGGDFSTYSTVPETSRVANINTGGTKVMQRRFIARSSEVCSQSWGVPPGTFRIMMDIYFTLNDPNQLAYYGLNNPAYGFDSPDFIAQSLNDHNANMYTNKSEIGIVLIRQGGCTQNPYQPFSWTTETCVNGKVNPITIDGDTTVQFISPINGVLAGKAVNANLEEKEKDVLVHWESENNELVDYFEVEKKDENGQYKTIGFVMSDNKNATVKYQFKDKITIRDVESFYRVKAVGVDKVITYSDVKRIRLSSEQKVTIKVFPNPSSESLRINLPVSNGVFVCRMYSTEGRMVQVSNVSAANPTVNIKTLQAGSYFMELYQPQTGKRYYTQFSKQ